MTEPTTARPTLSLLCGDVTRPIPDGTARLDLPGTVGMLTVDGAPGEAVLDAVLSLTRTLLLAGVPVAVTMPYAPGPRVSREFVLVARFAKARLTGFVDENAQPAEPPS